MNKDKIEEVGKLLSSREKQTLLRFSTAGSVDDGKSTLIGRLLHDTKSIYEDNLDAVRKATSSGEIDLSLFTDGLKAEREQKITIDVAYRYFSTPKRSFILADTPGHEQYTRNMATGASTSNVALVLVDATKGITAQTKRHSFILSLLGVKHILLAINKMDLVDYSQEIYENISYEFRSFAAKLRIGDLHVVPVSALEGDNVVSRSKNISWYSGESILEYLENIYIEGDRNLIDLRVPIQNVIRPSHDFRGFAGQVASGILRKGSEIVALPSKKRAKVESIKTFDGDLNEAFAPQSVVVTLDREIDISRGDLICGANNVPTVDSNFESMLVWMSENNLKLGKTYLIKHGARYVKGVINKIRYKVDINTLRKEEKDTLELNEIARVSLSTTSPLYFDSYRNNRITGSLIVIDPISNATVAAGMITDRIPGESLTEKKPVDRNLTEEAGIVSNEDRLSKLTYKPKTIWLTGLSGSGKSTIAKDVEKQLFDRNIACFRLDGDNIRMGLNKDLGFSATDRKENIRRIAEVSKLLNDSGQVAIVAFISPFKEDREMARQIIGEDKFLEAFVNTPLEVCESRDPKGLYKKARTGEIKEFTGISSPYEKPENPNFDLNTSKLGLSDCTELLVKEFLNS